MTRLTSTALALALAFGAFATPIQLAPEFPISQPTFGEPFNTPAQARVASNGSGYFATWTDHRAGVSEVYGARFSATGEVLDPLGIRIARGINGDVVWTGLTYVVAWESGTDEVSIATVSVDGRVGTPQPLQTHFPRISPIHLAAGANTVLLTLNSPIGALLNLDGSLLRVVNFVSIPDAGAAAVFSAGKYHIVKSHGGFLNRVTIDENGKIIDVCCGFVGDPEPDHPTSIDIATNGPWTLMIWTRTHAVGEVWSEFRLNKIAVSHERATAGASVVWRGHEYLASVSADGELYLVRLNEQGTILGSPSKTFGFVRRPDEGATLVARGGSGSGAGVWVEENGSVRAGLFDSASVTTEAGMGEIFNLAGSAHQQIAPRLTRAGDEVIAGWIEPSPDTRMLKIKRLAGGEPVTVADIDGPFDVLLDGELLWVVWTDGSSVWAKRYTKDLEAIDDEPYTFDVPVAANGQLSAAAGGGSLLFLWHQRMAPQELVGTILRSSGAAVQQIDVPITFEGDDGRGAVAAWNGSAFVAAWPHQTPTQSTAMKLRALRISASGSLIDARPTDIFGANSIESLRIDRAGDKAVLAWQSGDATFAVSLTGITPSPVRSIASIGADEEKLTRIAGLRNGETLFAWTRDDGLVRVGRASRELALVDDTSVYTIPRAELNVQGLETMTWLDLSAIALGPVIAYSRITQDEELGGAPRIFVRRGSGKRRAVR